MTKTLQHYLDRFVLLQLAVVPNSLLDLASALDEAVHDYFSGRAASVNNQGLNSQIAFLFENVGAEQLDQIFASVNEDVESAAASDHTILCAVSTALGQQSSEAAAQLIDYLGERGYGFVQGTELPDDENTLGFVDGAIAEVGLSDELTSATFLTTLQTLGFTIGEE